MKGTTITGRVPIQASKCLRLAVAWGHAVSRRLLIMLALIVMQMFPASAVARVVTVGVYENAPKVFLDESGKPAGIFVEIIEYVAKEEEWELAYVAGTWGEGLDRLARGEIDLMPDVAYAAEREKEFA
ncbi:MAG TPA: transporter substrate-binding domain-containing protein, partial [Candidatus Hydrogenedentes bacterium]|nr:transporter substrate-binding domain-containing protein [Candidatus Hydrogenedentota bacterium]